MSFLYKTEQHDACILRQIIHETLFNKPTGLAFGKWDGGTLLSVFDYRLIGLGLYNNERGLYSQLLKKLPLSSEASSNGSHSERQNECDHCLRRISEQGLLTRNNLTKNLPTVNIGFTFKHFNISSYACLLFRSQVENFYPFLSACQSQCCTIL